MKNLKSKIRDFLNSEEGRVGVKTPLALGVAAGGLMLAQTVVQTPLAHADRWDLCDTDADCDEEAGESCEDYPVKVTEYYTWYDTSIWTETGTWDGSVWESWYTWETTTVYGLVEEWKTIGICW